jgi:S-phase kinase-associated protein 1
LIYVSCLFPLSLFVFEQAGSTLEEEVTQEWYVQYISSMDRDALFELVAAANYLDLKPVLDLACLRVTFLLSGRNADEIRTLLQLPALTPEEEAQAREEHPWIFEDAT